jgi:hypothetical protein
MVTCANCGEIILLGSGDLGPVDPQPVSIGEDEAPATRLVDLNDVGETPQPRMESLSENPGNFGADTPKPGLQEVASPNFDDVVEFGNQELPSMAPGVLVYDIKISGVDTAEIRESLVSCLSDKRLGMNPAEILAQVRKGELVLPKVNPAKASVILSRIKHLPFKVSWSSQQLVKAIKVLLFFIVPLSGADASEWGRHEVNLKGYAVKLTNGQDDLRAMIKKKNENSDPSKRDAHLAEITKKNADLRRIYKEFKDEKEHIRFEHPEQGDKAERRYRHLKLRSLEELENEPGLDGQLSRLKKKVEETYPASPGSSAKD